MSSLYDVGSQYEGGMTWDSSEGTEGMTTFDARSNKTDAYTQRYVDVLTERDNIASGVIAIANNEAA